MPLKHPVPVTANPDRHPIQAYAAQEDWEFFQVKSHCTRGLAAILLSTVFKNFVADMRKLEASSSLNESTFNSLVHAYTSRTLPASV